METLPAKVAAAVAPARVRVSRALARDADEQAARLEQWDQTYEQISPGRFRGCLHEGWLNGVQIFREQTDQALHEAGVPWPDSFTVGVPIALQGCGCWSGEAIDRETVIALAPGAEMDFRTPRFLDVAAAVVDSHCLASHASRVGICLPARSEPADFGRILGASAAAAARLRCFVVETLDALDANPAALEHSASLEALTEAALDCVLDIVAPPAVPAAPRPGFASHALVRRAREHIASRLAEPPTVADLCGALGVSRRTLQYSFTHVLGTSPAAFLKALRLNAVRRALKEAPPTRGAIQDIAADWGFWHMGHFSRDYRRMFCESPSDTLSAVATSACAPLFFPAP